jgi:hypothetical protein
MSEGVHLSDVIINIVTRQRDPGAVATILTPEALRLRHAPVADWSPDEILSRLRLGFEVELGHPTDQPTGSSES